MSMFGGNFSGGIGRPEGVFRNLNAENLEKAVEFVISNFQTLQTVVEVPSGGESNVEAVTVAADGSTVVASDDIASTSRAAEGDYTITVSTSGDLVPVATIDYTAGNGGEGVSPYKEFSGFEVAVTDNTSGLQFEYSPDNDLVIAFGPDQDDLYKHDPSDWTTAAVQEDADGDPVRTRDDSGCISEPNGTYACLSGANTPYPVRIYNIATDTWYDMGTNTNITIVAADDTSGLDIYTIESGQVKKYTPTLGGSPAMNAAIWTAGIDVSTSAQNRATQDFAEGNLWFCPGAALWQFKKSNGDNVSHKYPTEIHTPGAGGGAGTPGGYQQMCFDPLRRCLYVMLKNVLATSEANWAYVYEYKNYLALEADSGQWFRRITIPSGIGSGMAIANDPSTETFALALPGIGVLQRYVGYPISFLDEVPVDDTVANIDINYDLDSSHGNMIVNEDYIIVSSTKGGAEYLIKVEYAGADIPLTSYGGAVVSRGILIAAHTTSSTTVRVITYLATSPNILVDAQFHCHIARV